LYLLEGWVRFKVLFELGLADLKKVLEVDDAMDTAAAQPD
jgi:hypothetical protein